MSSLVLEFLFMAALIVVAGVILARSCDRIAELSGLGRSLVGLVLLATATSLPELTVAWKSARIGAVDLTMGDVLGSSLINLAILAILDLGSRTRGRMLSKFTAAHALSATASILLTAIILLFLLVRLDWTIGPLGAGTVAVVLAYVFSLRLVYFDQRFAREEGAAEGRAPHRRWWPAATGFVAATATIVLAGPRLAETADLLAQQTGLGRTFFGTVFVAAITSLPEAVTTIEAVRLGSVDLAVGNIFGSNAFNMLIPAVADLALEAPILSVAAPTHAITAAAAILVTSVAVLGLLYRPQKRYWLVEPDAALMLLLILGSLALVYAERA